MRDGTINMCLRLQCSVVKNGFSRRSVASVSVENVCLTHRLCQAS